MSTCIKDKGGKIRCGARLQGQKMPAEEGTAFRYTSVQCKRECAAGSDLCAICNKHRKDAEEGVHITRWDGPYGKNDSGEIAAGSHVRRAAPHPRSEWNIETERKEVARKAKLAETKTKAVAAGVASVPKVKAALAAASSAAAAATDADDEMAGQFEELLETRAALDKKAEALLKKAARAKEEDDHKWMIAMRKAERELKKAVPKARATQKKVKSRSRSRSRKSSNRIYSPASAASPPTRAAQAYMNKWNARVSPNTEDQEPNTNVLARMVEGQIKLPPGLE